LNYIVHITANSVISYNAYQISKPTNLATFCNSQSHKTFDQSMAEDGWVLCKLQDTFSEDIGL